MKKGTKNMEDAKEKGKIRKRKEIGKNIYKISAWEGKISISKTWRGKLVLRLKLRPDQLPKETLYFSPEDRATMSSASVSIRLCRLPWQMSIVQTFQDRGILWDNVQFWEDIFLDAVAQVGEGHISCG